ncbi:MAG: flagellin FliC [Thermoleophilia bacterium]|nr:flagellin FliC [Thermoleophilia bacterium]
MGLRINNNIEAFNAHRNLMMTSLNLSKSMQRLSSGLRINSAADDAAGLGISERMRATISGLEQASRNAQDGISMVQTAEGALQEVNSILGRIRDLAVQYNNGTNDANAKASITAEVAQLSSELTRMIGSSSFNGIALLSGTAGVPMATLQIGANNGETVAIPAVNAAASLGAEIRRFATMAAGGATIDISKIDTAISRIAQNRSTFGAVQNRLEHTVNSLGVYQENLTAAESRIRDVDMASEMTNFTRLQILQQSGTAMLAQANMLTSSVLSLLK